MVQKWKNLKETFKINITYRKLIKTKKAINREPELTYNKNSSEKVT
jgi:hypothetical protein